MLNKKPIGEAPEGYKAVPSKGCDGCAFTWLDQCCINSPACYTFGISVIYVKDEEASAPATLLYPMGSLGEEIHD